MSKILHRFLTLVFVLNFLNALGQEKPTHQMHKEFAQTALGKKAQAKKERFKKIVRKAVQVANNKKMFFAFSMATLLCGAQAQITNQTISFPSYDDENAPTNDGPVYFNGTNSTHFLTSIAQPARQPSPSFASPLPAYEKVTVIPYQPRKSTLGNKNTDYDFSRFDRQERVNFQLDIASDPSCISAYYRVKQNTQMVGLLQEKPSETLAEVILSTTTNCWNEDLSLAFVQPCIGQDLRPRIFDNPRMFHPLVSRIYAQMVDLDGHELQRPPLHDHEAKLMCLKFLMACIKHNIRPLPQIAELEKQGITQCFNAKKNRAPIVITKPMPSLDTPMPGSRNTDYNFFRFHPSIRERFVSDAHFDPACTDSYAELEGQVHSLLDRPHTDPLIQVLESLAGDRYIDPKEWDPASYCQGEDLHSVVFNKTQTLPSQLMKIFDRMGKKAGQKLMRPPLQEHEYKMACLRAFRAYYWRLEPAEEVIANYRAYLRTYPSLSYCASEEEIEKENNLILTQKDPCSIE